MSEEYCAEQVRLYDYDSYAQILCAPRSARMALWAVYAFRVELSRIRSLVREPMMGLIRIVWWREAIAKLYQGETLRQEVLQALAPVITAYQLPESAFQALVDAYEADLETPAFDSIDELWQHGEQMVLPLLTLANKILGAGVPDTALARLARHDFASRYLAWDQRFIPYEKELREALDQKSPSVGPVFFRLIPVMVARRLVDRGGNRDFLLPFALWIAALKPGRWFTSD